MSKKTLGFIAAAAVALPILAPAAAMADDGGAPAAPSTTDSVYSLTSQEKIFSQGGADVGRGATDVVMSAVLGVEQAVLDAPAELTGEPKSISYDEVN
jgi:hypothetical protein